MELRDMIRKRKSTRSYLTEPVDDAKMGKIVDFSAALKPLYPDVRIRSEIIGAGQMKCIQPWRAPHDAAIFSEEKEGWLENAGFMYQQLDLFIQSLGLGACWLGLGRLVPGREEAPKDRDGLTFVIMLAFGRAKGEAWRGSVSEFKRKELSEITDRVDERLEPARLAPSATNGQPWYFTHDGDMVHAYCRARGVFGQMALANVNRIDMGIALGQLYVADPDRFSFFKAAQPPEVKGYRYTGSFRIDS